MEEGYIILKDRETGECFLSCKENFKETELCQTYDKYGVQCGCSDAGCYSWDNSESDYREDLFEKIKQAIESDEHIGVDVDFDMEGFEEDYWDCSNLDEVQEILNRYRLDFDLESVPEVHTPCVAWTFWDGSNFTSIVLWFPDQVDCFGFDTFGNYEEICELGDKSADELYEIMQRADDNNWEQGINKIRTYDFIFTKSMASNNPFIAKVEKIVR